MRAARLKAFKGSSGRAVNKVPEHGHGHAIRRKQSTGRSMAVFEPYMRRSNPRVGCCITLGALFALVGCGAAQGPMGTPPQASIAAVAVAGNTPEASDRPVLMEAAREDFSTPPSAAASAGPPLALIAAASAPAFEVVGTSIAGDRSFAVLKRADQSFVTVRRGERIDGYTIAVIEPDRVTLRSAGSGLQSVTLTDATRVAGGGAMSTGDGASEPVTNNGSDSENAGEGINEGVNTDQSIPEHPTLGPTAQLPEGVRQIGH
jgi:hypothetical protein